ncbi:TPA: Ig-like domain-containing protein [Vibrio parahaemolyticus]
MSKYFKEILTLVVLSLLVLLFGCNSENAFSDSKEPPVPGVKLERIDIVASPITTRGVSELMLAKDNQQSFEAVGHYSDGTSQSFTDLSVLDWHSSNLGVASFHDSGVLTAIEVGGTTLTATKDGIISNTVNVTVSDAVITSIQVTPSPMNIAKGQTQQLTATATFSDATSSDISSSVTWAPVDTATATVSSTGLLSAVEVGNTTLTATKDGVTSNMVNIVVCADLSGACIDIFDVGGGKLFTNSPSVAYLDSIGGSATNGTYTDNGNYGPVGDFYRFDWSNANTLCTTYNTHSLGGRTNWRLATSDELKVELFDTYNNMYAERGWSTITGYWSATPDGSIYYDYVYLNEGYVVSDAPLYAIYASCVSNP